MAYEVKILADSIASGVRLTTAVMTYPRIIHSEVMTHRVLSRNAASSRAIPVEKNIARVLDEPFIPEAFASNKKGMQGGDDLDEREQLLARSAWLQARSEAVYGAQRLAQLGVHKHWANRLLEPFSWITTVATATEWDNFFALRCALTVAPEFQKVAKMFREAREASTPRELRPGEWHLPYVESDDYGEGFGRFADDSAARHLWWAKLSIARCARVSYLTHEGKRDVDADVALYEKLLAPGHMSPLEHAARVATDEDVENFSRWIPLAGHGGDAGVSVPPTHYGNFRRPWVQHRKDIPGEAVWTPRP